MVYPFCLPPALPTLYTLIPECVTLWGQKVETEWLPFSTLIPKRKLNKETPSRVTPSWLQVLWRPGELGIRCVCI